MNYGVIGTSEITIRFIESAQEAKDVHLTSVYSRSYEKAKQFADRFKATSIYTDLNEMAKSDQIDVVYIASPNSLHFEQVKLFLEHKKHVICEKPIFSNLEEWQWAFEIADVNGVLLFEAARNIHAPNFRRLKDQIHKVGKIRSAVLSYMKYSSRYDLVLKGEEPNIFSLKYSGGALVDLGVYPIFAAVSLFGEPKNVSYFPVIIPTGVDGSGTLILEYDGFVCTILCSKIVNAELPCEIQGESGTITFDHIAPVTKISYKNRITGLTEELAEPQKELDMVYEIEAFKEIIETRNCERYEELRRISEAALRITAEARRQNDIVFGVER
ncbi:predicted dehydrogenase [Bacillus oleivorans]|uniref:Predicted dehydrogenase n=1 Tax=Bacillus oleivorans TaxID=1448271 RepID=A0A285CUC9_9BACI|nr:Gfo/Idh/MocA family oxidoreductase [Bacillus oleivorans]SNX70553.1 predicted dehydrogenase [Bacillus oleivorans]